MRTLVTVATNIFNRLTVGKVEIDIVPVSMGIFDFFTEVFNEKDSTFHMTFV